MSVVRLVRIDDHGAVRYAVDADGLIRLVDGDVLSDPDSLRRRVEAAARSGALVTPTRVLPPVAPSKIVAIGLNYRDHSAEMGKPLPAEPLMFLKPSTAVVGPEAEIVLPPGAGRVDHEAELGVVIGRLARHVPAARALDYVLGLTCVNDVTARDLQRKDVQYTRAKGFDTFAPLGPCIAVGLDPSALDVECCGQRRSTSGVEHAAADLLSSGDHRLRLQRDDAAAGRRDCHRHAVGRRRTRPTAIEWWSRSKASASCAIRSAARSNQKKEDNWFFRRVGQ